MKSRARAAAFASGALACAGLSAAVAGTAEAPNGGDFGALRTVIVTAAPLDRGTSFGRKELNVALTERRVPESFVPPDALGLPSEALGRKLATSLPPGSYLTAASLKSPATPGGPSSGGAPRGTTPVEIAVTGAGALAAARTEQGDRVDVIVSGDSAPGPNAAPTFVAATGVPLLDLREAEAQPGLPADRWIATLALAHAQALKLIHAESTGAQVRLLAS